MEDRPLQEAREQINAIDREMARLFEQRMAAVARVAAYKRERGLPILDAQRERQVIARNREYIQDEALRGHYARFMQGVMDVSKAYQRQWMAGMNGVRGTTLPVRLGDSSYDIILERGALGRAGEILRLNCRVLVVTDDGVPPQYAQTVAAACKEARIVTVPQGEETKTFDNLRLLLEAMLDFGMTRGDCAVAVGGGVVGDLTGFAAACYMRGIDFYNVPTTVLAQVDSSIGGKTAVNLAGVKNIAGAFHQPRGVLIDPDTLATLPPRQMANGLAEAVKMALCFDAEGFALFEKEDPLSQLDEIIHRALVIKKNVVEQDEREQGLRRALNFGHTLGHGIESLHGENGLYHGECVALGMLPMCAEPVAARLLPVLRRLGLPTACAADANRVMRAVAHDKKAADNGVNAVTVEEVGRCQVRAMSLEELKDRYTAWFGEEKA